MAYMGKTLLLSLLMQLASLGSATVALKGWEPKSLMGLKAGKSASASRVMTAVAELLQMQRDDPAAEHEVNMPTEDPIEELHAVLGNVIVEIEDHVQSLIIASRDATQAEINKRIEDLKNGNANLLNQKKTADAADDEWMKCVNDEKGMAKDIEDAKSALEQASNSRNAACQLQEDNRYFNYQMDPGHFKFQCDMSLPVEHNCDLQWQEFQSDVDNVYESLIDETEAAVEVYDHHTGLCEQAVANENAKEASLGRAIELYEEQHQKCLGHDGTRQLAMCAFETEYRHKCDLVTAYLDLMTEIDTADGGDFSHLDRVQEWTTTTMTTCLLRRIIETSVVDTTHTDECKAGVNIDPLDLSRQHQKYVDFTTEPNYGCAETSITFLGETWEIPASAPVPPAPSASYERVPFHPELPFSFCAASPGKQ